MSSATFAIFASESFIPAHDPGQHMFWMNSRHRGTRTAATGALLRLVDFPASGSQRAEHIADKAGVELDSTRHLLRARDELGLVEYRHGSGFGGSELPAMLRDVPGSLRPDCSRQRSSRVDYHTCL
jgi:hypothetical protein